MRFRKLALLTVVGLAVAAAPLNVEAKPTDKAPLQNFEDGSPVGKGAHTTLTRYTEGVSLNAHSRNLLPGHAYTTWLVVFNDPTMCSDYPDPCGEADAFDDNGPRPDYPAMPSVIFSGVGGVANPAGNLNAAGSPSESSEILFGPGILNAQVAELHVVVRDHGPASDDPATLDLQTSTFMGGCGVYDCNDPQFSIHQT